MSFLSLFTSLINFAAASSGSWLDSPVNGICLAFLGAIYDLISYSFNLFLAICQMNFNSLYAIIAPLVDRLEALAMVFVVFKVAMELIQYLLDPDKFPQSGKKLLINIFISSLFLVSYSFIFSFFNELGMLLTGYPAGYQFTTLSYFSDKLDTSETDQGLIMRFVFGDGSDSVASQNVGDFLAYNTIRIVIENRTEENTLENAIKMDDGDLDFSKVSSLAGVVGKTVKYTKIVGGLIGGFLIFSIVKSCIEIAVRMFKLLVLQIIAPVAIISMVDGGFKSKVFSSYLKTYISVYIEAFIRMLTMLVTVSFIAKFLKNIDAFFTNDISSTGFMSKPFLILLVMAGAFKMTNELPKFLDGILGTSMASTANGGFGSFVGGLAGGALGAIGGFAAGNHVGIGTRLANMTAGVVNGAQSGSKGKNVADFFKSTGEVNKQNQERALKYARQGGFASYVGHQVEDRLGFTQRQAQRMQSFQDDNKLIDNLLNAQANAIANTTDAQGIKYGTDRDSYASQVASRNADYRTKKAEYDSLVNSGANSTDILRAETEMNAAYDAAETLARRNWDTAASSSTSADVIAARKELAAAQRAEGRLSDPMHASRTDLENQKRDNQTEISKLQRKGATRRENRHNTFGG